VGIGQKKIEVFALGDHQLINSYPIDAAYGLSPRFRKDGDLLPHAAARCLVIVPREGKKLVFHPFDPIGDLVASDLDYLFVLSHPPGSVTAGKTFTYRPEVVTKGDKYEVTLAEGPEGATISKDQVVWKVPASAAGQEAQFRIVVRNPSKDETEQQFKVRVEENKK
jgi:hypothetical protein